MDDAVSGHMVAEAMLTAHFIAAALKAGMSQAEINAILAEVADRSARARRQALQIRGRRGRGGDSHRAGRRGGQGIGIRVAITRRTGASRVSPSGNCRRPGMPSGPPG